MIDKLLHKAGVWRGIRRKWHNAKLLMLGGSFDQ